MRVLVTRPIEAAAETVAALKARGHDAIVEPLLAIHIEDGTPVPTDHYAALILTSANGARAAGRRVVSRNIKVIAVGPATAQAARQQGFAEVETASGQGIAGIVAHLAEKPVPRDSALLHVTGADVAGDLGRALAGLGLKVDRRQLYRAERAPALSAGLVDSLRSGSIGAALFFSPRTAEIFCEHIRAGGLEATLAPVIACAISANAAQSLNTLGFRKVLLAKETSLDAMVDLLQAP